MPLGSVLTGVLIGTFLAWPVSAGLGSTPAVIEATRAGDLDVLRTLIADGTDVNAAQGDGAAALHWAAHRRDLEAANLLLEAGAEIDAANDLGATPLWLAAENGDAIMIRRLLAAGANLDVSLRMGETPLMSAARSGNPEAVELLVDHGADVNAAERERGQTALMWAVAQKHAEVARLLIGRGANLHARTKVWHQLENTAGNTNPTGNFEMAHGGSTPLLFAARNGDAETARVLIDAGADANDSAASGTSALVVAAHSGHGPLAVYLLEQGADPNAAEAGYTALHAAVLRSEVELVVALLEHGADPNLVLEHGTPGRRFGTDYSLRHQLIGANALWLAARYGELEILRALVAHGADPFVLSDTGMSALQAAMGLPRLAQENRRNRVTAPVLDPPEEERLTIELASILLDLGIDVNTADERGSTALHDAVRRGFLSVVELLAERGADLDATNARKQTPLKLAETPQAIVGTNGLTTTRPEIAELLRRLGAQETDETGGETRWGR